MTTQSQGTPDEPPGARGQQSERPLTDTIRDQWQRVAAGAIGALLLVRGLRQRSLRGAVTAFVGGVLLYGTLGGQTRIEQALESRTSRGGGEDGRTEATTTTSVSRSITVGKTADELYDAWQDPENFSQVMGHVADITSRGEDRYHWVVHGPRGWDVSWETHIVEDKPGEFLRWETPPDAMPPNESSIRFRPAAGDRGTVVTLSITIDPPGGTLGNAVLAQLDIVPETLAGEALRRFKSLVETGEIPTLSTNPSARGKGDLV